MPMPKGTVSENAALTNAFKLEIPILGTLDVVKLGALELELKTVTLADSTAQTTGKVDPVETQMEVYAHEESQIAAAYRWFLACQGGAPGHKQIGTLHLKGADNGTRRSVLLDGILCKGMSLPELDAGGDGEAVTFTWKMVIDNLVLL